MVKHLILYLIKNKEIRGLIGGLETTSLGDKEAQKLQRMTGSKTLQKQQTTRSASPIFEIIIDQGNKVTLNEMDNLPSSWK